MTAKQLAELRLCGVAQVLTVSVEAIQIVGLEEAIVLSLLVAHGRFLSGGFVFPASHIQAMAGIGEARRRRVLHRLAQLGLVDVRRSEKEDGHPFIIEPNYRNICKLLDCYADSTKDRNVISRYAPPYTPKGVFPPNTPTPLTRRPPTSKDKEPAMSQPPKGVTPKLWEEWLAWRKSKRMPTGATAQQRQRKVLEGMSGDEAEASIRQSMAKGWQGLFPPRKAEANVAEAQERWRRNMAARSRRRFRGRPADGSMPHEYWGTPEAMQADMTVFASESGIQADLDSKPWLPPDGWAWRKFIKNQVGRVDPNNADILTGKE